MKMKPIISKPILAVGGVLIACSIMDVLLTLWGLTLGAAEGNPTALYLMNNFGLTVAAILTVAEYCLYVLAALTWRLIIKWMFYKLPRTEKEGFPKREIEFFATLCGVIFCAFFIVKYVPVLANNLQIIRALSRPRVS
jgi:hypothetical protein